MWYIVVVIDVNCSSSCFFWYFKILVYIEVWWWFKFGSEVVGEEGVKLGD